LIVKINYNNNYSNIVYYLDKKRYDIIIVIGTTDAYAYFKS